MVFSTMQLPVTTASRADRKEMGQWPHLQGRNIDADVGLLIGSCHVIRPRTRRVILANLTLAQLV